MANVNMTIKPVAMLLSLINKSNNISLTEADVNIKAPTAIENPTAEDVTVDGTVISVTRNTSVDIDVLSDEVQDSFVTFTYERVDLAHLFSAITPTLLEVDVATEGAVSTEQVIAEVLRKFKVLTSTEEFSFTVTKTQVIITAKETNLAFIGAVTVAIEASLASRLVITDLDGFELPKPIEPVEDLSPRIKETAKMGFTE